MNEYNFEILRGSDKQLILALTGEDADGNKIVYDLQGHTAAMQIRTATYAAEAVDTLTTANGRLVIDPDAGKITVNFPHDVTEKYPVRSLVYDLEIKNASEEITRILAGKIKVTPEVTRVQSEEM